MPAPYPLSPKEQDAADHKAQAEHNADMACQVCGEAPDWAVTMCFYAALHHIGRHSARLGVVLRSHRARTKYIESHTELHCIRQDYSDLELLSQRARYDCPPPTDDVRDPSWVQSHAFSRVSQIAHCVGQAIAKMTP